MFHVLVLYRLGSLSFSILLHKNDKSRIEGHLFVFIWFSPTHSNTFCVCEKPHVSIDTNNITILVEVKQAQH